MVDRLLRVPVPPQRITRISLDFVAAAVWADEVRGEPGFERTGAWHFIDNPFGLVTETVLPPDLPGPENIVTELSREIAVLQNPAAKRMEKATALRFVIHLVGDLHQPLHCATRVSPLNPEGDRGGNSYGIDAANDDNLHSYWDSGLGTFFDNEDSIRRESARIEHEYPSLLGDWKAGGMMNVRMWMKESEALARQVIYENIHRSKKPSVAYSRKGVAIARKRVAWAGYRLARLLNAVCNDAGR